MYNEDSYLIKHFTNADISIQELPQYLLGDNWYEVLRNKMNIWGWTRQQPSMADILEKFRKVEYKEEKDYLGHKCTPAKAFVKEITVHGWSNSGQVALTLYRIKLHSENNPEYICWA